MYIVQMLQLILPIPDGLFSEIERSLSLLYRHKLPRFALSLLHAAETKIALHHLLLLGNIDESVGEFP